MNKICQPIQNSKVDWKNDVFYPITLFSIACLILLLSSFSTKASFDTSSTEALESVTNSYDPAVRHNIKVL